MIDARPITGSGFGAYPAAIPRYDTSSGRSILQQAHNDYLDLAATGGLGAVFLAAVFLFTLGRRILRNVRSFNSLRAAAALGSGLGVVGVLLHSLVDFGLRTGINANVFVLLVVLGAAAVGKSPPQDCREHLSMRILHGPFPLVLYCTSVLLAGGLSLRTGVSFRYSDQAVVSRSIESADRAIQFDSSNYEAFEVRGKLKELNGDLEGAIADFEAAVSLRPVDYLPRLQLAVACAKAGDAKRALQAGHQARFLAPNYARPEWTLGLIFLNEKDYQSAFTFLNTAADRDLSLLPPLLNLARDLFFADELVDQSVGPTSVAGKVIAANFYIDHNIESQKTVSFLTGPELADAEKDKFIRLLVDNKKFQLAFSVWASKVKNRSREDVPKAGELINGGFEDALEADDVGFAWQVNTKIRNANFFIEKGASAQGERAAEVEFSGNSVPSDTLLSQLVVVQPGRDYRLNFAFQTSAMVTGGPPVITVVDATNGKRLAESAPLVTESEKWAHRSLDIKTASTTAAIIIKLSRLGCPQAPCPAFGTLILDDFELSRSGL